MHLPRLNIREFHPGAPVSSATKGEEYQRSHCVIHHWLNHVKIHPSSTEHFKKEIRRPRSSSTMNAFVLSPKPGQNPWAWEVMTKRMRAVTMAITATVALTVAAYHTFLAVRNV